MSKNSERTEKNIRTLDAKAQDRFRAFAAEAADIAAVLGCEYVAISANRTWAEQDALYAQGRSAPGKIVTNARGGQSNHNFGIAMDFGVFRGSKYLDGGNRDEAALAAKVHKAVAATLAIKHGMEWGGSWTSLKDYPHFEICTGLSMAEKRTRFRNKGTVL